MNRTTRHQRLAATALGIVLATSASGAVVTRGPYLQVPTPTSMTVRWRTDVPTDSRVRYGAAPGSLGSAASSPAPTTEHVVTVSGLTAETQYFYSVGSAAGALVGDDADHYFKTNPPPGSIRAVRIFATGDGGYMNHPTQIALSTNSINVREAYYAFTGATPTDLFMPLGDNAYTTSTDVEMQRAIFDGFPTLIRSTPILPIYGNHEEFSSDTLTATGPWFDAFSMPTAGEAGGVASGSKTYFSFDYANIHIVVLDSERARAADSPAMMAWLAADLAAADADWTIAMWHRPPYSKGLFHDSDNDVAEPELTWMRANVLPVLEAYGVDAVFCGHSHNYERSYFLDGHYDKSPTFTTAFVKQPGDGDPGGDGAYRKITLGALPHSGTVYTVAGSSSEARPSTLNHPAHLVNLLQVGALVIDVDGNTLSARFLRDTGAIDDQFAIVKGCGATPATGCATAPKGKFKLKTKADPTKDQWQWAFQNGTVASVDVGQPGVDADVAFCVYDAGSSFLGGQVLRGAPEWSGDAKGLKYKDKLLTRFGLKKVKIKYGTGKGKIQAQAKGTGVGAPATPVTGPIVAQFVNLQSGKCWESTFSTFKKNEPGKVNAKLP